MSTITSYMSLVAWTDSTDPYSHTQLASNFNAIDAHDHTPGKGKQVPTGGIADHAITQVKLGDNSVGTPQIIDHSVTATKLDAAIFAALAPLGLVQGFWRPSGSSLIAWGNRASGFLYELCDGRTISGAEHDMGGGSITLPNLIDRFAIYGLLANVGVTGGANSVNLAHSHTVDPHAHTVSAHSHTVNAHSHVIGDHRHGVSTDGGHRHSWEGGHSVGSRRNAFIQDIVVKDTSNVNRPNDLQSLYIGGWNRNELDDIAHMDIDGDHNHGGQTGLVSSGNLGTSDATPGTSSASPGTSSSSPGTNAALGSVENRPAFFTLVPIVRVRNP